MSVFSAMPISAPSTSAYLVYIQQGFLVFLSKDTFQYFRQRDKDGNPCKADLIEIEDCNENPCPEWTEWTDWTDCSKSCGGGSRRKVRECLLPKTADNRTDCTGDSEAIEPCGDQVPML
jgi:hypothetical protein